MSVAIEGAPLRDDDPRAIGPYRIRAVLGEGGMSVVYLAEQEEPLKRTVALKIIKPGLDTRQFVARFDAERQTLAMLEHPNIAKVFDAGSTSDGRPYIVMERVPGANITRYCDSRELDTRARIALFVAVCAAVQHAHQKGVMHRDLKPSNILVAEDNGRPIVKVIDFGIAKAIDVDDDSTQLTRLGHVVGTPHYMSPEQAEFAAGAIDTRTDIYSLGVVLYELLSGVLPLDLSRVADYALAIALREREPPTPSRRISQLIDERRATGTSVAELHDLRNTLRGDLDWIVMKAIAKDRTLRYQSVGEFAADLERFLREQPVLARPPSARYIVGRFIRRNRLAVAAATITVVALVAGLATATVGLVRARAAEQRARIDAQTAERVAAFMTDLFNVSDPSEARGNTVTAREVLDKAAARLQNELQTEPAVRAALSETIAEVYLRLGLISEALPLAQTALDLRRATQANPPLVADSLDQVGRILTNLNRAREAEPLHVEALQLRREFAAADTAAIALTVQQLGGTLYVQSRRDAALEKFLEARRLWETTDQPNPMWRAEVLKYLGIMYSEQGRYAEAIAEQRQALTLFRSELGDDHPFVASTLSDLAIALKEIGQYPEAEQTYLDALKRQRKTLGPTHPHVANSLNNLASMLLDIGRGDDALRYAEEAIAIGRQALGEEHRQTIAMRLTAARALLQLNRGASAERELRDILAIGKRTLGADHAIVARALAVLADALNAQEKYGQAERAALEARTAIVKNFGERHWRSAMADSAFAVALAGLRRFSEAEALLLKSYEQLVALRGATHVTTLQALTATVNLYESWNKPEQAAIYREKLAKAQREQVRL